MELYQINQLTFQYPQTNSSALCEFSASVKKGEFITICGQSGSGKSTLLRFLKPTLAPHGTMAGEIFYCESPLSALDLRTQSQRIGFVSQNPEHQVVTDKVWHELAFGLESLGLKTPEIRARVAEMASFFGIDTWFHRNVSELSGGQKQLLNLASVMAMQPEVLLLDEPTGQLDPIAASEFLETLSKINRELGTTVILTEHRLEEAFAISDRIWVMHQGRLLADAPPERVGALLHKKSHPMVFALPTASRIALGVNPEEITPVTVREGKDWLIRYADTHSLVPHPISQPQPMLGEPVLTLNDVYFRYEKESPDILKGVSMKIYSGECYAILGGNGVGKTTTLSVLSGLLQPQRGNVRLNGRAIADYKKLYQGWLGVLPQNPQSMFVKQILREDLLSAASKKETEDFDQIIRLCRLEHLLHRHPYDLSGGEQQRAALAKILLLNPKILLLDEPTKGLDAEYKQIFAQILDSLKSQGITVVMVSHDVEFCAAYADRCGMFFDGSIVSEDTPRNFFKEKNFYTTAANRIARELLPDAILCEDVIDACLQKPVAPTPIQEFTLSPPPPPPAPPTPSTGNFTKKHSLPLRFWLGIFMALLAVPITIYFGFSLLDSRKYYTISILVLLEVMLPFVLLFEGRKPQARELILISVLCAIAVASRTIFSALPQFKPMLALIVITGVCFGCETGFFTGAITAFVSNFFLGQGPWTPWQMFAFGLIGFLSGLFFRKGLIPRSRLPLCLFGGFCALVLYGGIMNASHVILYQEHPTITMFLSAIATGFSFDLIHAGATVFFLWIFALPMLEKLERVKIKYGLL